MSAVPGERDRPTAPHPRAEWVSAHLFYHADLDDLLAQLVAPLVAELSTSVTATDWFYLRYWDGGPHVRLRVRCPVEADRAAIENTITRRAETYFSTHPSRRSWSDQSYRQLADQLARMEERDSYAPTLYPDNSTRFIGYAPETGRYGTGASIRAVERHFGESSQLCLALVAGRTSKQRRLTHAFSAVLLAWLAATDDLDLIRRWGRHGRSGAARLGPLPAAQNEHGDEHGIEARYARQRPALVALARKLRAGPPERPAGSTLGGWSESVTRLAGALAQTAQTVPHTLPTVEPTDGDTSLAATCVLPLLDLCAHLYCNRLGLLPYEEQYVRYLAARALADVDREEVAE